MISRQLDSKFSQAAKVKGGVSNESPSKRIKLDSGSELSHLFASTAKRNVEILL